MVILEKWWSHAARDHSEGGNEWHGVSFCLWCWSIWKEKHSGNVVLVVFVQEFCPAIYSQSFKALGVLYEDAYL